ncbi:hypothetical protein SOVF_104930, partial [Spinacia oleracea]
MLDDYT